MRTIAQRLFDRTDGDINAIYAIADNIAQSIEPNAFDHAVDTITFWDDSTIDVYADSYGCVGE